MTNIGENVLCSVFKKVLGRARILTALPRDGIEGIAHADRFTPTFMKL